MSAPGNAQAPVPEPLKGDGAPVRADTVSFARVLDLMRAGDHGAALDGLLRYRASMPPTHSMRPSVDFNIDLCRRRLGRGTGSMPHAARCRVGVVALSDRTKGLFRDVETVVWALASDRTVATSVLEVPSNLYRFPYETKTQRRFTTTQGEQTLESWLRGVDVIYMFEAFNASLVNLARAWHKAIVYVPNLEWASLSPDSHDSRHWEQALLEASDVVTTIARTASIESLLRQRRLPCIRVDWSIPDPVLDRPSRPRHPGEPVKVLFNAGNFGFMERRGLDVVLECLKLLPVSPSPIELVIKGNKPRDELDALPSARPGLSVRVDTRFLPDREAVMALYDDADVVLYPSRFEGLGLSLLEALHRGCYVLATDGEPMSELLPPQFPRIAAAVSGRLRHATTYEPSAASLAALLAETASRGDAILRVDARRYQDRQTRFRTQLASVTHVLAGR